MVDKPYKFIFATNKLDKKNKSHTNWLTQSVEPPSEVMPPGVGFRGAKKTNNRYFLQTKNIRRRDKRINSIHGNPMDPKPVDVSMPSPKKKNEIGTVTSPRRL